MRKYRPELGRWLSRDPIGEKADLVGVYVFCGGILTVDCLGQNNPSSFLDGVTTEKEAREIVERIFPNVPARVAKEMKMWTKAHGIRRSSLLRTTKKFLKRGSKFARRAGSALLTAVVLILTPLEGGAEPDCRLLLPPQDDSGNQTSWEFDSDYDGVVCEAEETVEVEHFDDARTFWEEVSETIDGILSEMVDN